MSGNKIDEMNLRKMISLVIAISAFVMVSCSNSNETVKNDHNNLEEYLIYPKGDKIENERFDGVAWLHMLVESDSTNHIAVGSVTFEPGARTNWHLLPDGQIILALGGTGYYQEQGCAKRIRKKGDVVT